MGRKVQDTFDYSKNLYTKFRCQGITQKKGYNIQNTAKV